MDAACPFPWAGEALGLASVHHRRDVVGIVGEFESVHVSHLGGLWSIPFPSLALGSLGSPLAACFAAAGFRVHAVDVDAQKVDALNRGVPPIHEPGLAELIRESQGRLRASQDAEQAVRDSDATFIVVGTPSEPTGGFSLRYVLPTCEAIGRALRAKPGFHLVVLTSTVMPESTGAK